MNNLRELKSKMKYSRVSSVRKMELFVMTESMIEDIVMNVPIVKRVIEWSSTGMKSECCKTRLQENHVKKSTMKK